MWSLDDGMGWLVVFAALWTVVLFTAVAFVGIHFFGGGPMGGRGEPRISALERARQRYAAGEISKEEFHGLERDLAGSFIPSMANHVVGVVDDTSSAQAAVEKLKADGFAAADIWTFRGDEGAMRIDASGAHHGLLAEAVRALQAMSSDNQDVRQYEDEALQGHCVLAVHAPGEDRKTRALETLESFGAHHVNYYGHLSFARLRA